MSMRTLLILGWLALFGGLTLPQFTQAQAPENDPSITVYVFMGEKCPICQNYTQTLKELHEAYASERVQFQGVFPNAYSNPTDMAAFQQKYALPFPITQDEGQALTQKFNVTVTPEVIVYDEQAELVLYQGRIDNLYARVGRRRKAATTSELKDVLTTLQTGQPVIPSQTTPVGCFITMEKQADMHHGHP